MAGITTHVLDTNLGRPIAGVRIDISIREGDTFKLLKSTTSNSDGRTDTPLVKPEDARAGEYEIAFNIESLPFAEASFIDNPVVRFRVSDIKQHYHVPMLCTPGSFSTYRGS